MDQQLFTYIDQELKRGVAAKTVRKALLDAGWESDLVEEAFEAVQSQAEAPSPAASGVLPAEAAQDEAKKPRSIKKTVLISVIVFAVAGIGIALAMNYFFEIPGSGQKPAVENAPVEEIAPPASEPMLTVSDAPAPNQNASTTENASTTLSTPNVGGSIAASSTAPAVDPAVAQRDEQRKADMKKLAEAQKAWFDANGKYYTCGLSGGDCGGKPRAYPEKIPGFMEAMPGDPSGKTSGICGNDQVYCGLNNAPYSNFFCYYAKLETGGYYTASHGGNFVRAKAPKIFEECAAAD